MKKEILMDAELVEISHIYENDICCGILDEKGKIEVRLLFAD